ncbi:YkyA family protein [Litchfieldia salsa]|uniref:Putative cell-wall binding lipoprotein n=1 Tax=Litchfieldia salsa TaxID=930152 RepID=A0A1H0RJS6_9BACI|nr:YkyA family protein [Litchfieldia salsa]SDP29691.1 Putative cell-wall binding lipoprotein [Litchfieldia salsa]
MRNVYFFKTVFISVLLLIIAGCSNGPTPEEEIYAVLEDVVKLEESFKEQQNPLVELEQKEKELYDEIIALSMKDFDKIVTLSKEAQSLVEERKERIDTEYESIKESKLKFDTVLESIGKLENEDLEQDAMELVDLMTNRYNSYDELYESYNEAVQFDKELYVLFQDKELEIENLQEQIDTINKSYDKVIAANEKFNDYTESYNQAKIKFYENAGLEVVYEDSAE